MAEKLQVVDLQLLSPESWDGHSSLDSCSWTEKPAYLIEPFYDDSLRDFAEEQIVNYLLEAEENPQPISTLKPGNTFDGNRLPEGTIIKYNREELRINTRSASWGKPHLKFDLWGVVCSKETPDGEKEKVIIPFIDFSKMGEFLPSPTEKPILTVGQTIHRRIQSGVSHKHISESLVKINSLEVHRIP